METYDRQCLEGVEANKVTCLTSLCKRIVEQDLGGIVRYKYCLEQSEIVQNHDHSRPEHTSHIREK